MLDGGQRVLRDVAMTTNFWLSMRYNFGCMIPSDTLFDTRGGFRGQSIPRRHSRARVSNFGTRIAVTGFE